ncbi:MAG: Permeases of the major facilitator superfamily [uncultured Segetibacter sp.]|uniref:Permeases of the major facilitator superfamily n=1 Tax=uncultured Segetibacter sp. TaxID=481133 RepID=A0A6J4SPX5_9BACT|nr:MAG: Permeases of the major facilitator superfamily [uncultured Segetibacter sp.]
MIELLAALSASAAAGMRIALPLLVIGLLQSDDLWSKIPLLAHIHPAVLLCILTSWSLFELFASKKLLGQRILQVFQLILSPIVGAIMGITVAQITETPVQFLWIIGIVGGLLALVIQLVLVGWFYRLKGLPLWFVFIEDFLCIALVIFAFDAPRQGGLIALLLLWMAIRSSKQWHRWYIEKSRHPRKRQMPD